jgi:trans-2,3-dihydro-3-hydroxyanthranilate isomerase
MRYRFHTLDVFTDRLFGGNPLAVFPQAEGLSDQQMRRIAREFNLSETVFVLPPQDPGHTCRLRIFTPAAELPFAGHPTVGTGFLLAHLSVVAPQGDEVGLVFEEGVGPVPVRVHVRDGKPVFSQLTTARLPEPGPPPPASKDLAAALSLNPEDILEGKFAPQGFSAGVPFLFVPLRDRAAVARAHPNSALWERTFGSWWASEVFVLARDPELPGSHLRARMFAPQLGIIEDPATGAACAALAGYMGARDPGAEGTLRWVVEQGFEMGRPSIIEVEADKQQGRITAVRVGGSAVLVSAGEMEAG